MDTYFLDVDSKDFTIWDDGIVTMYIYTNEFSLGSHLNEIDFVNEHAKNKFNSIFLFKIINTTIMDYMRFEK